MTISVPKLFRSYTFVLSVIYASLFCASIIVILAILYFASFQFLREQTDHRIDEDLLEEIVVTAEAPAAEPMEEVVVTASLQDVRDARLARLMSLRFALLDRT